MKAENLTEIVLKMAEKISKLESKVNEMESKGHEVVQIKEISKISKDNKIAINEDPKENKCNLNKENTPVFKFGAKAQGSVLDKKKFQERKSP